MLNCFQELWDKRGLLLKICNLHYILHIVVWLDQINGSDIYMKYTYRSSKMEFTSDMECLPPFVVNPIYFYHHSRPQGLENEDSSNSGSDVRNFELDYFH